MNATSRQLAAVWFADIVGFSGLSRRDETTALRLVELFQEVARVTTEAGGGRVVKFVGDGLLAYSSSASSAIDAALSLREQFQMRASEEVIPSYLRIGLHIGEVVVTPEGDLLGDGVNVASRLQSIAGAGQIFVSEDLWRQCRQQTELSFEAIGPRHIKGLDEKVFVHELSPPDQQPAMVRSDDGSEGGASLAILPFDLLGTNEDAMFLAAGVHNDLLTELSKIPDLTVISRTSVMGYQGTKKPIPVVAAELNVDTVIEGTVQSAGNRVRVTVQLIDGHTDFHRWAEYFDRELSTEALFDIQTELTEKVIESLHTELRPRQANDADGPATPSMDAYRLVVEGSMQFDRKTEDGLANAVDLFERATKTDPGYGLAWVGLADSLAMTADYGYGDHAALVAAARRAATKALELMPHSGAPHTSLGLLAEAQQDAVTALREYEESMRLDPNNANAHSWHAWVSLVIGRGERALVSATRSVELNPLSAEAVTNLALSHLAVGEPEKALEEAIRAGNLSEGYTTAVYYEGIALYDLGRFDEAARALAPLSFAIAGELTTPWASLGPDVALALARIAAGDRDGAAGALDWMDPTTHPFEVGLILAGLGEVDSALEQMSLVEATGYGPALLFHHHFGDVWSRLEGDPRLDRLTEVVFRSWMIDPPGANRGT